MLLCIFLLKNNILRFISSFFLNDIKKPPVCDIMRLMRNQNINPTGRLIVWLRGGWYIQQKGAFMLQLYDTTEILKDQGEKLDPIEGMTSHKKENLQVADAAELAGYEQEGKRLRSCGLTPVTATHKATGETGLISLFHCRVRLCPVCEWGRARANYARLSAALDWVDEHHPGLVPCFLTLTVKNTKPDNLRSSLTHMLKSFTRLLMHREIKRCVRGYWRAVEVTRNAREGTYHPHIHALVMMAPGYASKGGAYISHSEWVSHWKQALGVRYAPSVRIERVGRAGDAEAAAEHKAVLEVCKYSVKGSDILTGTKALQARVFGQLRPALAGVQLVGAGGVIREALRALKMDKLDALESPQDMSIARRVEASPADWVLLYWRWGGSGYVLDGRKDGAEDA